MADAENSRKIRQVQLFVVDVSSACHASDQHSEKEQGFGSGSEQELIGNDSPVEAW